MSQKIYSIQYLRGFSCLAVVFFHTYSLGLEWPIKNSFFDTGYLGVHVFFFISGFIISYIVEKNENHEVFFKKRLARIYPIYFQAYLVNILYFTFNHLYKKYDFGNHDFWDITLFTFFDTKQGIVDFVVLGSWTLYYEMFFYLVVASSLNFFKNVKNGINGFFIICCFFPKTLIFSELNVEFFFIFLSGFYFYELNKKIKILDAIILIICLYKVFLLNGKYSFYCCLLSIIFILFFNLIKLKELKSLTLIGDASYSIYLFHFPLLFFMQPLIFELSYIIQGTLLHIISATIVMMVILIGIFNYEFVEKPIAKKLQKFIKSNYS